MSFEITPGILTNGSWTPNTGGKITLPLLPNRCAEDNPSTLKLGDLVDALPLIFSIGKKQRQLVVEGYIYALGSSKATLASTYINPLRALVHTIVDLDTPDGIYDGYYIFENFNFEQSSEYPAAFKYKLLFTKGDPDNMEVL